MLPLSDRGGEEEAGALAASPPLCKTSSPTSLQAPSSLPLTGLKAFQNWGLNVDPRLWFCKEWLPPNKSPPENTTADRPREQNGIMAHRRLLGCVLLGLAQPPQHGKPTVELGFWRGTFVEGWVKNPLEMFKFRSAHPHPANPYGLTEGWGWGGEYRSAVLCYRTFCRG